jgi:hypothetical protein
MEHSQSNLTGATSAGLFHHGIRDSVRVGELPGPADAPSALQCQDQCLPTALAQGADSHFPVSHP